MIPCDLHIHTTMSDGSLSPRYVVEQAEKVGLKIILICDHDTMAGIQEAQQEGNKLNIQVLPGVEISCLDPDSGRPVHVLCYGPQKPDKLIGLLDNTLSERRRQKRQK